jgi:hypothetical protein
MFVTVAMARVKSDSDNINDDGGSQYRTMAMATMRILMRTMDDLDDGDKGLQQACSVEACSSQPCSLLLAASCLAAYSFPAAARSLAFAA